MNDYMKVRLALSPCSEDATDLCAALLADIGYESFEPDSGGLTAYVPAGDFSSERLDDVISDFPMPCAIAATSELVPGQDWNTEWEKHYFQPIVVGGECVIHSTFHTDVPTAEYDIVIDPKMAFGTGHHATTAQIIRCLLEIDLDDMEVIDMGTGTGILAILCAMRGARKVTGIEIDAFAYANALENISLNSHPEIRLINGDASALADVEPCNIFIANINRNIITADLPRYAGRLKAGGTMLLSGFYEDDIPVIMEAAAPLGLKEAGHTVEGDNWTCLQLKKEK